MWFGFLGIVLVSPISNVNFSSFSEDFQKRGNEFLPQNFFAVSEEISL
jgi:hypothetical protein